MGIPHAEAARLLGLSLPAIAMALKRAGNKCLLGALGRKFGDVFFQVPIADLVIKWRRWQGLREDTSRQRAYDNVCLVRTSRHLQSPGAPWSKRRLVCTVIE